MPICPNCGKEATFTHHGGYSGDGWNEPREWQDWLTCNECGAKTDDRELERCNEQTEVE